VVVVVVAAALVIRIFLIIGTNGTSSVEFRCGRHLAHLLLEFLLAVTL
jgi:hypothetical protein